MLNEDRLFSHTVPCPYSMCVYGILKAPNEKKNKISNISFSAQRLFSIREEYGKEGWFFVNMIKKREK